MASVTQQLSAPDPALQQSTTHSLLPMSMLLFSFGPVASNFLQKITTNYHAMSSSYIKLIVV
eukprot:4022149-Ditylum_brightwellii.AAC.1